MKLPPPYAADSLHIVHNLHYDWSAWTSKAYGPFPKTTINAINQCKELWKQDGMMVEKWYIDKNMLQILFKVSPNIAPQDCTRLAKGRIQHALRQQETPVKFSRRVAFRSLGDNTRAIVKDYIGRQITKSDYADPRFKEWLEQYNFEIPKTRLKHPEHTAAGRYWYALHLVIVVQNRSFPMTLQKNFSKVAKTCFAIAEKKEYEIAELSIMPDHIHIALRGNIAHSAEEMLAGFMNNLWYSLNIGMFWSSECYAGTFSEYKINQIR
jgi:REP element-mobilizing transposase RayT